jgi:hypothetical protein
MARYVCTGTCNGSVSEEEFKRGKSKCATKGCNRYGKQLVAQKIFKVKNDQ